MIDQPVDLVLLRGDHPLKTEIGAYDASYLELALRINAPIATLDKELRTKALKAGATVLAAHSD